MPWSLLTLACSVWLTLQARSSFAAGHTATDWLVYDSQTSLLQPLTDQTKARLDSLMTDQEFFLGDNLGLWIQHMRCLFSAMHSFHNTAFYTAFHAAKNNAYNYRGTFYLGDQKEEEKKHEAQKWAMNTAKSSAWFKATEASRSPVLRNTDSIYDSKAFASVFKSTFYAHLQASQQRVQDGTIEAWSTEEIGRYTYRNVEQEVLHSFVFYADASGHDTFYHVYQAAKAPFMTHELEADQLLAFWQEWNHSYEALDNEAKLFLMPWAEHLLRISRKIAKLDTSCVVL